MKPEFLLKFVQWHCIGQILPVSKDKQGTRLQLRLAQHQIQLLFGTFDAVVVTTIY